MKLLLSVLAFALLSILIDNNCLCAQNDTIRIIDSPYKLNYYIDIPITGAGLIASRYGTDYLRRREPKHPEKIPYLSPNDIWWFDRGATKQDPSLTEHFLEKSNSMMTMGMWLPAVMFLDKKVRHIWHDYTLLYLEAQAVNASVYLAASIPIPRMRPFMYNPEEDMERKSGRNTTNSFFSGHTSIVSTSTFFMVKIYYDLHPEAKNRVLFYSLAAIPPAVTGYYRYKGGKHFPTDVLTGIAVGALSGILVPELHKNKTEKLSFSPIFFENGVGLHASIKLN